MIKLQYSEIFEDTIKTKCNKLSSGSSDRLCFILSMITYETREIAETKAHEYADRLNIFIDNNIDSDHTILDLAIAAVGEMDIVKLEYIKAISSLILTTEEMKLPRKIDKNHRSIAPAA
ncbi:MAG: hypothetical protein EOP45_21520 [Sphingobacteriaceae bacterium]|nr:MAG: hypothetical protein EOP45_21520 [Sphingobacteriaceae bacterium]